jgi:putative selenium metabolism hydrolase
MLQKIIEKSEQYRHEIAEFLKEIVSIPSYSCQEEAVVKRILTEMETCGFEDVHADQLGNAVGRSGNGRTVILYDAHVDVVGIGDPNSWDHLPFPASEKNGRIMGRGAVDEKPAMACMIWAGRIMKELGLLGEFTLHVVGSVMEEDCDGYPLQHLIEKEGIRPQYVVLGEPTDLNVYRGHRGRMEIVLRTRGRSAHGAHAQRGENAIYKMAPIIAAIEKLNDTLAIDPFLGKGSITISRIESTSPSLCSVADSCEIYLDRRMTVGESRESVLAELRQIAPGAEIEVPVYEAVSWRG